MFMLLHQQAAAMSVPIAILIQPPGLMVPVLVWSWWSLMTIWAKRQRTLVTGSSAGRHFLEVKAYVQLHQSSALSNVPELSQLRRAWTSGNAHIETQPPNLCISGILLSPPVRLSTALSQARRAKVPETSKLTLNSGKVPLHTVFQPKRQSPTWTPVG